MNGTVRAVSGLATVVAALTASAGAAEPELVVARNGKTDAIVVVSPDAGLPETKGPGGQPARGADAKGTRNGEWLAAADLVKYVEMMTGAGTRLAATREEITTALKGSSPVLVVGEEALAAKPEWAKRVRAAAKKNPVLGADAIGLLREGNRVYLAGNNDEAHYFAVAELLWRWGCRWYIPTDFGECIPEAKSLTLGDLDYTYGPPFEIRGYWISWVGDNAGRPEFQRRNMMVTGSRGFPPAGHALGAYTKDAPGSKNTFNFPITAPETAAHVAGKIEPAFAKGQGVSISMEDGLYDSEYPGDVSLMKLQWDKYFMRWSVTDPMLELYNNIARTLQAKHPNSGGRLGFLIYANMTIPPVRKTKAEKSLFGMLAPIDIDPNHGMDDAESPPRQEYRDMLYQWAEIMEGRLAIYDYDQGMLVWRDIPNPSHQAFAQDVKHYRLAGILGVSTESRNAIATTFLNLFLRGRLMWNPDEDVPALLKEFYPRFYGPAAKPMETYWSAIYDAWADTIVTEHEHFAAPAIYTPELIESCRKSLEAAEKLVASLRRKSKPTRHEQQVLDRMKFTRTSFEIMDGYLGMARAAATDCDYKKAVQIGEKTLPIRESLTDWNGIFTTYRKMGERGPAWWPGEVEQYRGLLALTDGTKGRLVAKLPLEWAFRRDKKRVGAEKGYATQEVDLAYWNATRDKFTVKNRMVYPDEWEMLRTDLYAQAQGIRDPDRQSFTGDMWYRTEVELTAEQAAGKVHVMFPGLFNKARLYVNGQEAARRDFPAMWWHADYKFEWDVDLAGKLKAGRNTLALVANCEHHFGGMFRRPFLYALPGK
ncbi:MAG: DUF4838 domain-containing protein [Planctomycetes bacterium]|nr:DUF4838 domain-containing protein [Planctomycetota bacterium]